MDGFWDLFAEALRQPVRPGQDGPTIDYAMFVARLVVLFRKARAADKLSVSGYPLDAHGLLRDVKDEALLLLALGTGLTSADALDGGPRTGDDGKLSDDQFRAAVDRAKAEEGRLKRLLIGNRSGLRPEVQQELNALRDMYHWQVHGSKFDRAGEIRRWLAGSALSIGPASDERDDALIATNLEQKKLGSLFAEFIDQKMPIAPSNHFHVVSARSLDQSPPAPGVKATVQWTRHDETSGQQTLRA